MRLSNTPGSVRVACCLLAAALSALTGCLDEQHVLSLYADANSAATTDADVQIGGVDATDADVADVADAEPDAPVDAETASDQDADAELQPDGATDASAETDAEPDTDAGAPQDSDAAGPETDVPLPPKCTPTQCDDGNICTTEVCNPAGDCTHTANDGAVCDDGKWFTVGGADRRECA